ncbi:uncharacterized protein LOC126558841 [Anopheles maculipalpis]|uniref:uncharacterized protein LOC126558841 n=1 Tax=Anopheles maculipalpis TaxID=1496333 RepID=UPI0021595347|nr:uncharacterized protein LOC126558841 [Anopheles maculipalpis]
MFALKPTKLTLLVLLASILAGSAVIESNRAKPRQRRFLIFPRANPQRLQLIGGFGIPADIQLESITMGYVFKSVYLLPWNSSHWIPPFLDRHEFETERADHVLRRREAVLSTAPLVISPQKLYERYDTDAPWQELESEGFPVPKSDSQSQQSSRWTFYRMLEQLFEQKGLDGRSCVLRAICESSEASFTHTSGLIGELLHIAFTPSSTDEVHVEPHHTLYGQAERVPRLMSATKSDKSVCADMFAECKLSLLDSFSNVFGGIM